MLLAYAFLWGGAPAPAPVARDVVKHDVDAAIEQFLHDDIVRAEGGDEQVPHCTAPHRTPVRGGVCMQFQINACDAV